MIALVLAVLPCVPGFLNAAAPARFPGVAAGWIAIYNYAWFVGFGLAGALYLAAMKVLPPPDPRGQA